MLSTLAELYAAGHDPDWDGLCAPQAQWVELPTYAWQRTHHWRESAASRRYRLGEPDAHPLLDQPVEAPLPTWEVTLDAGSLAYLRDHRVAEQVVFPGAAYAEVGLALAEKWHGAEPCTVEQLELLRPLALERGAEPTLRTTFDPQSSTFTIDSTAAGQKRWTHHARGRLRPGGKPARRGTLAREEIVARCPHRFEAEEIYGLLSDRGLQYGPRFQGLRRVWHSTEEVLAEIQLPTPYDSEDSPDVYRLHPAALDAALQSLVAMCAPGDQQDGATFVPVSIERLHLVRNSEGRLWSHARLIRQGTDSFEAELRLCDESGRLLVELQGVRCGRLPAATTPFAGVQPLLYDWRWEAHEPEAPAPAAAPSGWLVLGDESPLGPALTKELRRRGHVCHRSATDNPEQPLELVYLWTLESASDSDPVRLARDRCMALVRLLAELTERGQVRGLTVVTRGAQQVLGEDPPVALAPAALWGLVRVAANEHPELRCRLLDLNPAVCPESSTSLADTLETVGDETELAIRTGRAYVHRLRPRAPGRAPELPTLSTATPVRLVAQSRGTLDGFAYHESRRRAPGPGEVELAVRAVGLNFKDVLKKMGLLSERIVTGTYTGDQLGMECSGVVVRVGPGVESFAVGDRVATVAAGYSICCTCEKPATHKAKPETG